VSEGKTGSERRLARYLRAGILAVLLVGGAILGAYLFLPPTPAHVGVVRSYYIAAQDVDWNYTPAGYDEISGTAFGVSDPGQLLYTEHNGTYLGETFLKCVYKQYTDGTFTTLVPQPAWEGIMGPTLYAEVGDTIQVTFKNECQFPESVHPHGVFYNVTSEGALYNDSAPNEGQDVPPGGEWVYRWYVPERAGPGPMDGEAVMWMYHSHVYEPVDVNDGLIGSIIISAPGDANPNGTPEGYTTVVSLLFNVFSEDLSAYEPANIDQFAPNQTAVNTSGLRSCIGLYADQTCTADPDWANWSEAMRKYSINGFSYGNLPMIYIPEGAKVLWCMMGMGYDFHTAAFDGNDLMVDGERTDVVPMLPAEMVDGTMWANQTGTFLIESLVTQDIIGGMTARYTVYPTTSPSADPSPAASVTGSSGGRVASSDAHFVAPWTIPSGGPSAARPSLTPGLLVAGSALLSREPRRPLGLPR
jgi:manganese oxidase